MSLFCLIFVWFIHFLALAKSETCNDSFHICVGLSKCRAYVVMTNPDYKHFKWCDIDNGIVCCPQVRFGGPVISEARIEKQKPFDKDCEKWRSSVYENCPPEGLVSKGTDTQAKEIPHMALIGFFENGKYDWFCGGSLISSKFVLTAAHCLYDRVDGNLPNRIRLGEINYNSTSDGAQIQEFTIKNHTSHPKYNFEENYWDIALLELNREAVINENVVPICLPHTNGSEHARLYAAGWGLLGAAKLAATHLQKVILERFEDDDCVRKIGKDANERPDGVRPTHQICAGSFTDERDTCQGDSGGPLFIEHAQLACMYELHGITSFGAAGCGNKGSPGVYTRLLPYVEWIESIVWGSSN